MIYSRKFLGQVSFGHNHPRYLCILNLTFFYNMHGLFLHGILTADLTTVYTHILRNAYVYPTFGMQVDITIFYPCICIWDK